MNFDYTRISSDVRSRLLRYNEVAYTTVQGVQHTYLLAKSILDSNVVGDFVECGVAAGAQIGSMLEACQQTGKRRMVHLFDSFQGIPLAGPNDTQQPGMTEIKSNQNLPVDQRLISSGVSSHSSRSVLDRLRDWGFGSAPITVWEGWFQHTLPTVGEHIQQISLLRLDGDLYESTAVCLQYLYDLVLKGGWIVVDDYVLVGCRRAVQDFLSSRGESPTILTPVVDCGIACWQK